MNVVPGQRASSPTTVVRDELTPLLPSTPPQKTRTPLPTVQLGILLLIQFAEPISSMSIYPYINQLVGELDITGGDKRKVGYYAGLLVSSHNFLFGTCIRQSTIGIPLLCHAIHVRNALEPVV